MDEPTRLRRVSSLYGPGTVGSWLLILLSVLITWTINARSRKADSITNNLIATLSLPTIASINLIYKLHNFPGPIRELLISSDAEILEQAASIEAPLNVCETFSAFAIAFVGIAVWFGHVKRSLSVFLVGMLGFSTEIIGSRGRGDSVLNFTRPFVFDMVGLMISILVVVVLLSVPFLVCLFASHISYSSCPVEVQMRREYAAVKWRKLMAYMTFWLSFILTPVSVFTGSEQLAEAASHYRSYVRGGSQIPFFIPWTSSSITDLDQAAAFAGGIVTLGFSIYSALKTVLAQDKEDFERWSRCKNSQLRSETDTEQREGDSNSGFRLGVSSTTEA